MMDLGTGLKSKVFLGLQFGFEIFCPETLGPESQVLIYSATMGPEACLRKKLLCLVSECRIP